MPKLISELDIIADIALDDVVIINDTSDTDAETRTKAGTIQQLSDALISTAGAIPAVTAPVLNAGIPVFSGTGGAMLADSGQTVASILATAAAAASPAAHAVSTSNPHSVTAAQVGALPTHATARTVSASADVLTTDNGNIIIVDATSGAITLTLPEALPLGMRVTLFRFASGGAETHAVTLAVTGGAAVPTDTLRAGFEVATLTKVDDAPVPVWTVEIGAQTPATTDVADGAPALFSSATGRSLRAPSAPASHNTATLTLAATHDQGHVIAEMAAIGAGLVVSIPDTLRPGFRTQIRKNGAADAITFASGAGLITPEFYGQSTATADGSLLTVFVESASVALVRVEEPAP